MKNLEVRLTGKIKQMDARALTEALGTVIRMLQSVATDDETGHVLLDDLRVSSAKVVVKAADSTIDVLSVGLRMLRTESVMPEGWNETTLAGIRDLERVSRRAGVSTVELGSDSSVVVVDSELAQHALEAEDLGVKSLGSISGTLYRYSSRGGPEASLADDRTGKSVRLALGEKIRREVIELLDRHVTVWGILTRNLSDNRVIHVKVNGIEERPGRDRIRPPVHEGLGLLGPDWLDGEDPTAYVRRLRDRA